MKQLRWPPLPHRLDIGIGFHRCPPFAPLLQAMGRGFRRCSGRHHSQVLPSNIFRPVNSTRGAVLRPPAQMCLPFIFWFLSVIGRIAPKQRMCYRESGQSSSLQRTQHARFGANSDSPPPHRAGSLRGAPLITRHSSLPPVVSSRYPNIKYRVNPLTTNEKTFSNRYYSVRFRTALQHCRPRNSNRNRPGFRNLANQ